MRIPDLPGRMRRLVQTTPGITCFVPAGNGVAVEAGYRHPVELRACAVFDPAALALLRGRGDEPWVIERVPPMGALSAFARIEVRTDGGEAAVATRMLQADAIRVPLRMSPSSAPRRNVTATWVPPAHVPLLRLLAYALPHATIAQARIAVTTRGAFVRSNVGIEAIPLGTFFVEVRPNLYLPAGYDVTPAVAPEVLARALGVPVSCALFIGTDARAWSVDELSFVPLETALVEAPPWEPIVAESIERTLEEAAIDLKITSVGLLPALGVEPPRQGG
jgi:hypothetical protein